MCFCCKKSFDNTVLDITNHFNKVLIGSLFVYYKRIFLSISFKGYFFSEVRHAINMLHPEFIYSSKCESALEFCKFILCTSIAKHLYLSRQKYSSLADKTIHINNIMKSFYFCDFSFCKLIDSFYYRQFCIFR